jgi:hypothetical protein
MRLSVKQYPNKLPQAGAWGLGAGTGCVLPADCSFPGLAFLSEPRGSRLGEPPRYV